MPRVETRGSKNEEEKENKDVKPRIPLTRVDLNIMHQSIPVRIMDHCDVTIASGWPMCRWRHNRPSAVKF